MLVLLAEDQTDLAELTIDFLEADGIECDYASNGEMAMNLITQHQYDVIVLDVAMPKANGFDVCSWMNARQITTPVIFLTAKDTLADKRQGFSLGAEDYLTKPFELEELAMRIQVLGRRKAKDIQHYELEDLMVDFAQRVAIRGKRAINLTSTQWQLLALLSTHSPNLVTKDMIIQTIWPEQDVNNAMYKTLLFRFRNLIDGTNEAPLVHTIRGTGIVLRSESN